MASSADERCYAGSGHTFGHTCDHRFNRMPPSEKPSGTQFPEGDGGNFATSISARSNQSGQSQLS